MTESKSEVRIGTDDGQSVILQWVQDGKTVATQLLTPAEADWIAVELADAAKIVREENQGTT